VTKGFPGDSSAMSRFCGLPMGLATLPMVTAKARARRSGLGGILQRRAIKRDDAGSR
jgi:hypothetical protein